MSTNTTERMKKIRNEDMVALARKNKDNIISAQRYYVGNPDGKFITKKDFDEETVKSGKAYETINTLLGDDTAELVRFLEGKKQTVGLISAVGLQKICELIEMLFIFACSGEKIMYETVRACRQNEIAETPEGKFDVIPALKSTTKSSIEEIMKLGYGNKNKLAICRYHFHNAVVLDMERFGKDYLKPEEKEVLILIGNKYKARCIGESDKYFGKDNKPALMYEIDVYPPDSFISKIDEPEETLKKFVFDSMKIAGVKEYYEKLNKNLGKSFPQEPEWYRTWKKAYKMYLFCELGKIYH